MEHFFFIQGPLHFNYHYFNTFNSFLMPIPTHVDYRENPSGIPELLAGNAEISLIVSSLSAGDHIINEAIGVERKSAEDFVQKIIGNRLFEQLARLKKSVARPL